MTIPTSEARLVILALAVAGWLITWCARFLPVPIRSSWARSLIGLAFAAAWFATLVIQGHIYRSMTGIRRGLGPFGWFVLLTECAVNVRIGVGSSRALRRKAADRGFSGIGG